MRRILLSLLIPALALPLVGLPMPRVESNQLLITWDGTPIPALDFFDGDHLAFRLATDSFPPENGRSKVPNYALPRGRFQIRLPGSDRPGPVEFAPSRMLFAIGGKESDLGPLFETLSQNLPWGSLNTFGTYGRFFIPRALPDMVRRVRNTDGALVLVQGHFEGDPTNGAALVVDERRLPLDELKGFGPRAVFLFFLDKGSGDGKNPLPETPAPFIALPGNPGSVAQQTRLFFETRVAMTPDKPWQTMGDLLRHLNAAEPEPGTPGRHLFLRWSRYTAPRQEARIRTTPIYTEITNFGRTGEIMRNGVTYRTREENTVKQIQTGILTTTNVTETPERWEDPTSGF